MEDYIGGHVHTLDTNQLEDVIRYRNGTMMPPKRGQKPDEVRVCIAATDEYEIPGDYLAKGYTDNRCCLPRSFATAHRRGLQQLRAPTHD